MSTIQSSIEGSRSRLVDHPYSSSSAIQSRHVGNHLLIALTCIVALEFVAVACSAYAASFAYSELSLKQAPSSAQYIPAALFIAILTSLTSLSLRQFTAILSQSRRRFVFSGIGAVAISFAIFLSAMFVFKVSDAYSRGSFLLQFAIIPLTIATFRVGVLRWLRLAITSGYIESARVVLISDADDATILADLLEQGVKVSCRFRFPDGSASNHGIYQFDPDMVRKIVEGCRLVHAADILILSADNDLEKVADLASLLSEVSAAIHVLPHGRSPRVAARVGELGGQVTLQLVARPLSRFQRVLKRIFDLTAAVSSLMILFPLLLLISILIKLDSRGPILFRQVRHGYNNQKIKVFKFRTMRVMEDGFTFNQAKRDDVRVTLIGRVLRRSNIDELPQLLNVVLGEMSIVGPRPHAVAHNEEFERHISALMRRHRVKPGITGWAQVNGYRGQTDTIEKMKHRVEHDLFYIDNWSFLFDLQIILLTLLSKRAYVNAR